jgi:hypothetical protein
MYILVARGGKTRARSAKYEYMDRRMDRHPLEMKITVRERTIHGVK